MTPPPPSAVRHAPLASMQTTIIGIDCAVSASNLGLALGRFQDGSVHVETLLRGADVPDYVRLVEEWLRARPTGPALLALDAPLGWPTPLGRALTDHRAGEALGPEASELFRRATDDFVWSNIGKRPLDVGADRIARTARAALALLQQLRERLGAEIPLAWEPAIAGVAAIEVYPAATLMAHSIPAHAYKHAKGEDDRQRILDELDARSDFAFAAGLRGSSRTSDEVDAVLCLLAAQDFLRGETLPLSDRPRAEKEGWIWVHLPASGDSLPE